MSTPAPFSDTDRNIRIALISCSCVAIIVLAFRRCTQKGLSATVNNLESRGDIVLLPQERVIRVDQRELKRLKIAECYSWSLTGRYFLPSSATNDVDEDVGVPLQED